MERLRLQQLNGSTAESRYNLLSSSFNQAISTYGWKNSHQLTERNELRLFKLRSSVFVRNKWSPSPKKKKKEKRLHWNESSPCLGLRFTAQRVTAPPKNSHHMDASHDLLLACWLVESRCFSSHQPGWEGWLVMFRNVWVKMFWMFICRVQRSLVQSEKMVLTIDCKRLELTVLLYLHSLLTVLYNTVMTKKS